MSPCAIAVDLRRPSTRFRPAVVRPDVDCSSCSPPPVHGRGDVLAHPGDGRAVADPDGGRHLPGDRHSGRRRDLELSRPVGAGHGAPGGADQRARVLDHRQRHRAHRVAVDPRHRHAQGLLPAGRGDRRGDRADLVGVQHDPAHHAARHAAAERHPVQRVQRPGRAADGVEREPARAAGLRLRPELHPRAAVHDPGPGDAGAVRRQAAADQRRHRSARAGQQGAVAVRRRERAVDRQRDPAGGHRAHRRARVQRHPQQQPAQRRGVRANPGQDRRRRAGDAGRRRARLRRVRRPDQHRAGQRASARRTWRSSSTPTRRRWRWSIRCATCCR